MRIGVGKTTALRILATLPRPDAGAASVNGFDVREQPRQGADEHRLTGQFASVDEDLTGVQNLVMIGQLLDLPKRAARRGPEGREAQRAERHGGGGAGRPSVSGGPGRVGPPGA